MGAILGSREVRAPVCTLPIGHHALPPGRSGTRSCWNSGVLAPRGRSRAYAEVRRFANTDPGHLGPGTVTVVHDRNPRGWSARSAPLDDLDASRWGEHAREARTIAGRYQVDSRLGMGGMAEVLLARDVELGRLVALKLLAPALAADPVFVERFRREATAIASLNNTNVVVVYDHGVTDGQPFIVMEYVAGRTLKQIITGNAPLSAGVAVGYARQVLDGVAAAHAVGIIHRDIKPQNLLVREDDTVKVADFGVARSAQETMLTQHGSVVGTADYIAPEQAQGGAAMPASDLYSIGVVIFEMLTGRLPFIGELPLAVANQHVQRPAPPVREINPAVPAALARVVDRALNKEPTRRFQSAADMKAALAAALLPDRTATLVAPSPRLKRSRAPTYIGPPLVAATHVAPPAAVRTSRRLMARLSRRHVLFALALVAVVAGAVVAASLTDRSRQISQIPDLVGVRTAAAKSELQKLGFKVRVAPAQHAGEPSGTVVRTRPSESAALASVVTITPSSGPRSVRIPAVSGRSQDAAMTALRSFGLLVRPSMSYGSTPRQIAIGTTPPAGTAVPPHSSVELIVSAGPAPVEPVQPAVAPSQSREAKKGKENGNHFGRHKKHGKPDSTDGD